MALSLRVQLYRLEQTGSNAFAVTGVFPQDLAFSDIDTIVPVNALLGADIGGVGYLYSKITMKQPGLNQESYALQTVQQLHAAWNA